MTYEEFDILADIESLHREASAMLLMLEVEYRHPTPRENELFDNILKSLADKRSQLDSFASR